MLLHNIAGGPRQCHILRQMRSALNRNRLIFLPERKLLMFMHTNTNWPKAPVLRKTIRFQNYQSRNLLGHCMWKHWTWMRVPLPLVLNADPPPLRRNRFPMTVEIICTRLASVLLTKMTNERTTTQSRGVRRSRMTSLMDCMTGVEMI